MMSNPMPLLLLALSAAAALAAPAASGHIADSYDDTVIVPQKRAALVLDRLLIALQKALHEDAAERYDRADRDGPRTAPLRIPSIDDNDMMALSGEVAATRSRYPQQDFDLGSASLRIASAEEDTRGLQRRGQTGAGRGRVILRCYFNAVTCF